jgi:2-oxoglutarate dehydrogenase E2 component (dihydrolipoamide succinyltransferase)
MSQIVVPQLGESVVEARVGRWLKSVGDRVTPGEPLVELETDKIDLEVGADQAGVLARIDRQEGDDVKVGDLLAVVESGDGASAGTAGTGAGEVPTAVAGAAPPSAAPTGEAGQKPEGSHPTDIEAGQKREAAYSTDIKATATARRMAEGHDVDLAQVTGTGEGGRITKEDVQKYLASGARTGGAPEDTASGLGPRATGGAQAPSTGAGVPASLSSAPSAVRPAVSAAAPAATQQPASDAAGIRAARPPAPSPQPPAAGARARKPGERTEERVRMSKRRATIARRLVEAQHTAAMLTTFNEVDMSAVMALRARRKEVFQKRYGVSLGLSSFFVKASLGALRAFPRLNAEIQGDEIVLKHYYDIGIAVGASGGLVVPVLRDVDIMSFAEIEFAVRDFAKRAEDATLTLEDLAGGTFTITNGGVFGSLLSTPILNPPQVGILGLHKIEDRPVAVGGQVVVKPMMYVALTYDHRIVDGLEAVQFLVKVKELIEDPGQMLIEI